MYHHNQLSCLKSGIRLLFFEAESCRLFLLAHTGLIPTDCQEEFSQLGISPKCIAQVVITYRIAYHITYCIVYCWPHANCIAYCAAYCIYHAAYFLHIACSFSHTISLQAALASVVSDLKLPTLLLSISTPTSAISKKPLNPRESGSLVSSFTVNVIILLCYLQQ